MSETEQEFSFKNFFVPLTKLKAFHIIVFVGLVVFANMLFDNFVWDDITYIQLNPDIHTFNIFALFTKDLSFNSGDFYRPIPAVYFATLYAIVQNQPFFYHFVQLILHITVTCLIFVFFVEFFSELPALILALIFLVHPFNVESVSYIGATQSELYSLFGMSALLLSRNIKTISRYTLIGGLLLLALLTKEVAIVYFFMLLLWQILFKKKETLKSLIVVEVIALTIYAFFRFMVAGIYFTPPAAISAPIAGLSLEQRLIQIPSIFFYYIKTFIFPKDLAVLQNWHITTVTTTNFYIPLTIDIFFFMLFALIGRFAYRSSPKKFKTYLFFIIWFLSGMVFLLQLFPLDNTVSDRWFYLPMVGLLGVLGLAIQDFFKKNSRAKMWSIIIAIIVLCLLSIRTMVRNTNWYSEVTLYSHDIPISDDYYKEDKIANYYFQAGQYQQALAHEQKSVGFHPIPSNLNNLGEIYQKIGKYDLARESFEKAVSLSRNTVSVYTYYANLALLDIYHGDPNEAVTILKDKILIALPTNPGILLMLAVAEYKLHHQDEALQAAQKAYNLSPTRSVYYIYSLVKEKAPMQEINSIKWNN